MAGSAWASTGDDALAAFHVWIQIGVGLMGNAAPKEILITMHITTAWVPSLPYWNCEIRSHTSLIVLPTSR